MPIDQMPSEIVTVDPKRCLGGIPIDRTRRLSVAHQIYETCPVPSRLPGGKYLLTAHDEKLALLEEIRFGHRFVPHISWITETKQLLPRTPEIYSDTLPIIVEQDGGRPCVHHNPPPFACKLWRYMDIDKFESLLIQGGIFLARADRFLDGREGTLALGNASYRRHVYSDDPKMANAYLGYCDELQNMRRHTYISCWRIDEFEDARSWREYTTPGRSVVIQTTYYKLWKRTQTTPCATVEYVDYDQDWVVEGNSISPFFHKCKSLFDWEQEFRIIYQQFPRTDRVFRDLPYFDCSQPNQNDGCILTADVRRFVDQIVTHPGAEQSFVRLVRGLASRVGLREAVIESRIKRVTPSP